MEIKRVNNTQPHFCALKRDTSVLYYLKRFSEQTRSKVDLLEMYNVNVPIDTYVTTKKIFGRERIVAKAGTKTFVESIFRGPVNTIRKALGYASRIAEEQRVTNEMCRGMAIPKIN